MKTFIIISLLFLNIISVFILFKMLKGTEIKTKLKVAGILIIVDFILTVIICGIGQAGITQEISQVSKPYMLCTIFPINLIIIASPIAVQINKMQSEEANKNKLMKSIIKLLIIDIIIIIIECIYVKNTQMGIENMRNT